MLLFCYISFHVLLPKLKNNNDNNNGGESALVCIFPLKKKKINKGKTEFLFFPSFFKCSAVKVSQCSRRRPAHRCSPPKMTCVFQAEPLNSCSPRWSLHTSHFRAHCASGIHGMDNACKVWQDGVCFASTLVLRNYHSGPLFFEKRTRNWEAQARFHRDFPLCPRQSGVCMSDSASYLFAGSMLRWPM